MQIRPFGYAARYVAPWLSFGLSLVNVSTPAASRGAVMGAVLMALLLAGLNQTMVSTAMPRIVGFLGGMDLYSWVFSAYMLTSTLTVPIFGKLSDLFGRRSLFLIGIALFSAGSLACGFAGSMLELIVYRGIQGLGAGAIFPIAFAVVADLYPPAERGRVQGWIGATFGVAGLVGPLTGGWIVDHLNWHWVFLVNVPMGVVAWLVATASLPKSQRPHGTVSIDYMGASLLILAMSPLMLATAAQSQETVTWLGGLSLLALTAFIWVERRSPEPIVPLGLFGEKTFLVATTVSFLTGIVMFGNTLFIPLFVQGVLGTAATTAGLVLTPMMLATTAGSIMSGQLASRSGRYSWIAILGLCFLVAGAWLLTGMTVETTVWEVVRNTILVGIGLGVTLPLFPLAVQNTARSDQLGTVTSLIQFSRGIGGTLGVALFGVVLAVVMKQEIRQRFPLLRTDQIPDPQSLLRPESLAQLSPAFREALQLALAHSLHQVFWMSLWLAGMSLLLVFFLPDVPLRRTHKPALEERGEELAVEGLVPGVIRPEDEPELLG